MHRTAPKWLAGLAETETAARLEPLFFCFDVSGTALWEHAWVERAQDLLKKRAVILGLRVQPSALIEKQAPRGPEIPGKQKKS